MNEWLFKKKQRSCVGPIKNYNKQLTINLYKKTVEIKKTNIKKLPATREWYR